MTQRPRGSPAHKESRWRRARARVTHGPSVGAGVFAEASARPDTSWRSGACRSRRRRRPRPRRDRRARRRHARRPGGAAPWLSPSWSSSRPRSSAAAAARRLPRRAARRPGRRRQGVPGARARGRLARGEVDAAGRGDPCSRPSPSASRRSSGTTTRGSCPPRPSSPAAAGCRRRSPRRGGWGVQFHPEVTSAQIERGSARIPGTSRTRRAPSRDAERIGCWNASAARSAQPSSGPPCAARLRPCARILPGNS